MALTRTGDSLYFSSNDTILKLYKISNQSITILDTLKEGALDAMICLKNGNYPILPCNCQITLQILTEAVNI